MKVLFIDIDGVINSSQGYDLMFREKGRKRYCDDYSALKQEYIDKGFDKDIAHDIALSLEFDPMCISNLRKIIELVPDVKFVLSSTWRLGYNGGAESGLIFSRFPDIQERFIDRTKRLFDDKGQTRQRGDEILEWIERHPEVESFAVIDDDGDMDAVRKNFIHVDSMTGLTVNHAYMAQRILLGRPERRPNWFARTCRSCSNYIPDSDESTSGTCKTVSHMIQKINHGTTYIETRDYTFHVAEDFKCPMYQEITWRGSNEETFIKRFEK